MLARTDFPGRSLVRGLVLLPMELPPVVGGAALLFAFGRRGLVGGPVYDGTGFLLPFSLWSVTGQHLRGPAVPGGHCRGRSCARLTAATRRRATWGAGRMIFRR